MTTTKLDWDADLSGYYHQARSGNRFYSISDASVDADGQRYHSGHYRVMVTVDRLEGGLNTSADGLDEAKRLAEKWEAEAQVTA